MQTKDILDTIRLFDPLDDGEARKSLDLILALLEHAPDPCSRDHFHPGHITTTGLVLRRDNGSILLVHHARLDRWLLPGGHVEPSDASLAASAAREVLEETGVHVDSRAPIVNVDVHPIPPRRDEPLHLHHDLIFAFRANSEVTICSPESRAVIWCKLDELSQYDIPSAIRQALRRARQPR